MKHFYFLVALLLITSCIPIRIAPKIEDQKIMVAKKFKRQLPEQYAFIFKDPKDANEFYTYIDTKFQLNHIDVDYDVPFKIDGVQYFLSFYEAEKSTETINLVPIAIDAATSNGDFATDLSSIYTSRTGTWYLALTVMDNDGYNCLNPVYPFRQSVINYLKSLKQEYLTTHEYAEVLFKKTP
ncbi:hypothetical protein [Winogradskyella immobilis]|uniref:Lipoprotein n=1 Tax=Winogradskyella immobilis TaxID=2816852 RepID=A0ABS8EQP5_9FLAO|nr:hypothetical protein [Winogradskyella immobilis]MCC1485331.1 hypothetical protein [Winogradskyella immobilis]MCG0017423.1 hypothetical protein [Winogradskyella immobilis]